MTFHGVMRATGLSLILLASGWTVALPTAAAEPAGQRTVAYELAEPRRVSMAVYDADGRLVREFLRGEPQAAGAHSTVVEAGALTDPHRVAWVPDRNQLLVAEHEESHQVKRFSLPGGRQLQAYGQPGGRSYGPYDPASFRELNDVAPDNHGGFLVVEGGGSTIQRTARFDAAGALIDQWFGPQMFFNYAVADPREPGRVFLNGGYGAKTELRVDYATGEWTRRARCHQTPGNGRPGVHASLRHKGVPALSAQGFCVDRPMFCVFLNLRPRRRDVSV